MLKMAAEKVMDSSEMRSKSSNWTLACDMQLRLRLEATKERLHQKAQNLSDSINDLNAKTMVTSAKLGNFQHFDDFLLISQFFLSNKKVVYFLHFDEFLPSISNLNLDC